MGSSEKERRNLAVGISERGVSVMSGADVSFVIVGAGGNADDDMSEEVLITVLFLLCYSKQYPLIRNSILHAFK